MTKQEVVNAIRITLANRKVEVTQDDIEAVVNTFTTVVKQAVVTGETVTIRGFGSFGPQKRAAKKGRNITAGTSILIPEHVVPQFVPAAEFKAQVRLGQ
jgi:nucleoid DNA-binding protein